MGLKCPLTFFNGKLSFFFLKEEYTFFSCLYMASRSLCLVLLNGRVYFIIKADGKYHLLRGTSCCAVPGQLNSTELPAPGRADCAGVRGAFLTPNMHYVSGSTSLTQRSVGVLVAQITGRVALPAAQASGSPHVAPGCTGGARGPCRAENNAAVSISHRDGPNCGGAAAQGEWGRRRAGVRPDQAGGPQ